MALRSDTEPPVIDEADGQRRGPVAVVGTDPEVPRRSGTEGRQGLGEMQEALELRAFSSRTEGRVVDVLTPPGSIDPGCL